MRLPEWLFESFRWVLSTIKAHAKTIGILAGIGTLGGLVKWLADIRKSWHEGNLAKEQLRRLRKEKEYKEKLPAVVKLMEAEIEKYRKEHRFGGRLILEAEFFLDRLPRGTDRELIERGISEIEAKQQKYRDLFRH